MRKYWQITKIWIIDYSIIYNNFVTLYMVRNIIISTNSTRCTKCTSCCTKWIYDNKNVQNECITINNMYICKRNNLYSHSRKNHNVGKKTTTRNFFLSCDLFVNDYLTNKRRKNIQASYVRKKVTAPFHALSWTRVRSRRYIRARVSRTLILAKVHQCNLR